MTATRVKIGEIDGYDIVRVSDSVSAAWPEENGYAGINIALAGDENALPTGLTHDVIGVSGGFVLNAYLDSVLNSQAPALIIGNCVNSSNEWEINLVLSEAAATAIGATGDTVVLEAFALFLIGPIRQDITY